MAKQSKDDRVDRVTAVLVESAADRMSPVRQSDTNSKSINWWNLFHFGIIETFGDA